MGAFAISVGVGVGLIAAMALVPAFLPGGEWLPLPAAGAVVLCSPFLGAIDWTALIGVALIYALIRYFTVVGLVLKRAMLVISRFLVTALVAAWLDVALPASPGRTELIVTVIAVIVAVQLLSDALLLKFGTANPLRNYSAVFWAVTGTALVMFLSAEQWGAQSPETQLHATSGTLPSQFIVASVTMGFASAAYSLPWPRRAGSRRPELLAPLYFIVAALCTGPVLHAGGASIAWAVTSAYLLVAGTVSEISRLRGAPSVRR